MSTDRILQKIRQEAEGEADAVISAAREKAAASAKEILDRAKETADLTEKGAVTTAEEVSRRTMQAAGLEARKNSLMSRRTVIDEAFELAGKRLLSLPEDRYEALISALVVESAETGNESISVNTADLGRYKNGLLQKLNAALEKAGKRGGLTLSAVPADIGGGLLLVGDKFDVDLSFEALIRAEREISERAAAEILFGPEVG